jgi:hypothetical protein
MRRSSTTHSGRRRWTRTRWLRVWQAEQRGAGPRLISVAAVGHGYAIRDVHYRASVSRARRARRVTAAIA